MSDLLILCPTRGRPAAAQEAYDSFILTAQLDSSEIMFLIDDDDPEIGGYEAHDYLHLTQPSPGNMVHALNAGALWAIENMEPKYIGFVGDDHRFRTPGWDIAFKGLLETRGGGMVYGNDTVRVDGDIPTQIVMSASIIQTLGWMGLPTCTHLYIDNVWRVIGDECKALFYMPDIVIEHLHPAAGKVEWDDGHKRVNTSQMYEHDAAAFSEWLSSQAESDIRKVREALGR